MPIYEYACQKCGHQFDALQKVSDAPLRKCPGCGALRAKRLISAPQFRLKGTGWYETDFKKNGQKRLADSGAADAPAGDKAADKAADKPADKAADKPADKAAEKPAGKPAQAGATAGAGKKKGSAHRGAGAAD